MLIEQGKDTVEAAQIFIKELTNTPFRSRFASRDRVQAGWGAEIDRSLASGALLQSAPASSCRRLVVSEEEG